MDDRQEILGELALGRLLLVLEHHELDLVSLHELFDEPESEPGESAAMGNGN